MLNTYLSNTRILVGETSTKPIFTIPFDTLVVQICDGYLESRDGWMRDLTVKEYFKGRVIKAPSGNAGQTKNVVLGCPSDTDWDAIEHYSAKLSSVGNPDHRQYRAVSPSMVAFGLTIEDACTACVRYRDAFELGCGNWSDDSGRIYQHTPGGKPKLVGRVWYNGRYLTNAEVREDRKQWKKAMAASD